MGMVVAQSKAMLFIEAPGDKHKGKINRVRGSNNPLKLLANLTTWEVTEIIWWSRHVSCVKEFKMFIENAIATNIHQNWKVTSLLKGLGFNISRDVDGDSFTHSGEVKLLEECWAPSEEAHRVGERYYITAYSFQTGDHTNVIVWLSSSTQSGQLFTPIALSSLKAWDKLISQEFTPTAWERYLFDNEIRLTSKRGS